MSDLFSGVFRAPDGNTTRSVRDLMDMLFGPSTHPSTPTPSSQQPARIRVQGRVCCLVTSKRGAVSIATLTEIAASGGLYRLVASGSNGVHVTRVKPEVFSEMTTARAIGMLRTLYEPL